MHTVVGVIAPFFVAVVAGYVGTRLGWISARARSDLNAFVLYVALPALIIRCLAGCSPDMFAESNVLNFVGAYIAAWLVMFAITAIAGQMIFHTTRGQSVIQGYGGSYPNTGYLGLPILVAVLGDWAVVPAASIVAVDIAVTIPIVLLLLESSKRTSVQWVTAVAQVLRRTLTQPLLIAVAIGFVLTITNASLPWAIDSMLGFLGAVAGPLALFCLGATLAGHTLQRRFDETAYIGVAKLAVHPLVAWFFLVVVFSVEPEWIVVGLLASALPTAATVFVLAEHYDIHAASASNAVVASTLASLVTVPAIAYFILTWPPG